MSGTVHPIRAVVSASSPAGGASVQHEVIRALEIALGSCRLTRMRAAKRLGIGIRTLQRWLAGTTRIDVETLCQDPALARVFASALAELLVEQVADLGQRRAA